MNKLPDPIRGILFDLDGTLVDTTSDIIDAVAKSVRKHGHEPDMEAIRRGIGQPIFVMLGSFLPADIALAVQEDYIQYYNSVLFKQARLFSGIPEGLSKVKEKYPMGIVTGKRYNGAVLLLKETGILDYFDVVVGADTTERGKPYADPIFFAAEKLGLEPYETIYIGDAEHDIHAAKNAGAMSAAVLTGTANRDELKLLEPDYLFESVGDFFKIVG
jgi:pyrophosphatase PpaX